MIESRGNPAAQLAACRWKYLAMDPTGSTCMMLVVNETGALWQTQKGEKLKSADVGVGGAAGKNGLVEEEASVNVCGG
jgi:hypothetical protein